MYTRNAYVHVYVWQEHRESKRKRTELLEREQRFCWIEWFSLHLNEVSHPCHIHNPDFMSCHHDSLPCPPHHILCLAEKKHTKILSNVIWWRRLLLLPFTIIMYTRRMVMLCYAVVVGVCFLPIAFQKRKKKGKKKNPVRGRIKRWVVGNEGEGRCESNV